MKNKKQLIIGLIVGIVIGIIIIILVAEISSNYIYSDREEKKALKNITYNISKKFEKDDYGYSIYHSYYDENTNCYFKVETYENKYEDYKDGKEYLKDKIYFTYNDKISEIKDVELNNYKWYYLSKEKDNNIEYIYATKKDDIIYILNYEMSDYANGDGSSTFCISQYDKVISSVKFK